VTELKRSLAAADLSSLEAVQKRALVLAFGDSLYAGYGLARNDSFPAALERALGGHGITAQVINAGVSGETTAGGRGRLESVLQRLERRPDLVLVGLGANDVFRGFSPDQTRRNLDAIIRELTGRGIPVMLTGIAAPAGFRHPVLARFEAVYSDLARQHGVELEPSFLEGVSTNRGLLLADGVHPNSAGVSRMAQRVAPQVAAILRSAIEAAA
jgi:acyl-CoA thioesterase-1